mgnify:CR=1 FL=1
MKKGEKLKVKKLTVTSSERNDFLFMAIDETKERTPIYLHRRSKEGEPQWYESKADFSLNTAYKYFYQGFYKVVFYSKGVKGISKSNVKDWI